MFGYDVEVVKRNQMHTFKVLQTLDCGEELRLDGMVQKAEQRL
jgi:hypothetical protein